MNLSRRQFLKGLAGAGVACAGTGAYSTLVEPHRISVERATVPVRDLHPGLNGFRLAVLSDFHLHPFTRIELIADAVRVANSLKPDLVALLGDYVDESVEAIRELAPALGRLNARLGVFGVLGNHDLWKGPRLVREALQREGIHILRNEGLTLSRDGGSLHLAGLDDVWAGHPNVEAAMASNRRNHPTIQLVHEPDYADVVARDHRVALQLSGHTHGGQVRVPFLGALRLPSWGRKYQAGLYRVGRMHLYTNRGIGCVNFPIRLNCPPEVTELTLVCA